MNRTDLAYRRTAAEAASGLGLLISLFDTLAGNLRRAGKAQREDDIERRCREGNWHTGILARRQPAKKQQFRVRRAAHYP